MPISMSTMVSFHGFLIRMQSLEGEWKCCNARLYKPEPVGRFI